MESRQEHQYIPLTYRIISPFILILATIATYFPSLNYDFQFDDIANIQKHFEIRHNSFIKLFLSGSTRWISYWLNALYYKIDKFNPFYYRVGSVAIHTINGLLIFFILQAILTRLPRSSFYKRNTLSISFITALLFLLHPVQTQTVSYVIQGQLEGLALMAILSIIGCFIWQQYTTSSFMKYFLIVPIIILCIASVGTKEIAIVTPALVLLVDWFFVAHGSWTDLKKRWWVHCIITGIIITAYVYLLGPKFFATLFSLNMQAENNIGNIITERFDEKINPLHFFISQFKVILHYIWIYIFPLFISVEYDWVLSKNVVSLDCIIPFIALSILTFLVYKLLQHDKTNIIGFAALWFAITIAPRSSIMPSPELLVDYKTYTTSFSLIFLLTIALVWAFEKIKRLIGSHSIDTYKLPYVATTLLALVVGYGTAQHNTIWSSGRNFWGSIIQNAPGKIRAYNNYGVALSQEDGKFQEAIPYYLHAIKADPKYRDPYNNLAVSYASLKQLDKAIETLKQSLRINPYYPEAHNNIASFLIEKKDYVQAEKALRDAIRLRPYYGKAHFNLGRIYMETEELEKAWECFKNACTLADLDNEGGFIGYAQSSLYLKKYDDAIFACQKILEINPHNEEARFNLANCYFMTKQFDNAALIYEQTLKANPQDAKTLYNLAETHFSAGKPREALACFTRIKNIPGISQNVFLRIARCHEKLGNTRLAKNTLDELLQHNIPTENRQQIEIARNRLVERYKLS